MKLEKHLLRRAYMDIIQGRTQSSLSKYGKFYIKHLDLYSSEEIDEKKDNTYIYQSEKDALQAKKDQLVAARGYLSANGNSLTQSGLEYYRPAQLNNYLGKYIRENIVISEDEWTTIVQEDQKEVLENYEKFSGISWITGEFEDQEDKNRRAADTDSLINEGLVIPPLSIAESASLTTGFTDDVFRYGEPLTPEGAVSVFGKPGLDVWSKYGGPTYEDYLMSVEHKVYMDLIGDKDAYKISQHYVEGKQSMGLGIQVDINGDLRMGNPNRQWIGTHGEIMNENDLYWDKVMTTLFAQVGSLGGFVIEVAEVPSTIATMLGGWQSYTEANKDVEWFEGEVLGQLFGEDIGDAWRETIGV